MYAQIENYAGIRAELMTLLGDTDYKRAELLLRVELGLYLLEFLGLDDETITVLWVLLSGTPIYSKRIERFSPEQRRAVANARQLLPYSSRVAWENALRAYMQDIPDHLRDYNFKPEQLQKQIVNGVKRTPVTHPNRQEFCQASLTARLPYYSRQVTEVKADKRYRFYAQTKKSGQEIELIFKQAQLNVVNELPAHWLSPQSPRVPLALEIKDLEEVARFIDQREAELHDRYASSVPETNGIKLSGWHSRWQRINYTTVSATRTLSEPNTQPLVINGFTNVVGMVSSGKSTLALLILAYVVIHRPVSRVTMLVQDVPSALQLANQLNWWFRDNPETDAPIAVPLLGASTRDKHLADFWPSEDYQNHRERGQPHWAERWLSQICPLQALVSPQELHKLDYQPITPGKEPCQSLRNVTERGKNEGQTGQTNHLCPLFARCPSKQLYFDMPQAPIWITTPGALTQAGVPNQLDPRSVKLGEIVWEQSDIVIYDEADAVMEWLDHTYAQQLQLTNGGAGILDELEREATTYNISNRTSRPPTRRWIHAARDAGKPISNILTQLSEGNEHKVLEEWVEYRSFNAYSLFYKLSRRMAGLKEFDDAEISQAERADNEKKIEEIMPYFEQLFEIDPLRERRTSLPDATWRLAAIMQRLSINGESASDPREHKACKRWIKDFAPKVEQNLMALKQKLEQSKHEEDRKYQVDTLDMLAHRLQFALDVAVLDYHSHIVFYEWHNRPPDTTGQPPQYRLPRPLQNILPAPPLGRQFGVYFSKDPNRTDDESARSRANNNLDLFAYTNIGRSYLLDYPTLRADLEGQSGPHVLALSGTAWLPDSTHLHIDVAPAGVLQSEEKSLSAIGRSNFYFWPQRNNAGKPIRVSGDYNKLKALKELAASLVGSSQDRGGQLGAVLTELDKRAKESPAEWEDRQRILLLVNSYEQAEAVAEEIKSRYFKQEAYYLTQQVIKDGDDVLVTTQIRSGNKVIRPDIERFADSSGKILVAPLGAIGRGFNILNEQGKAAFGAVFFLTRPYPHPNDAQAIAQEINRSALQWAKDPDFIAWKKDGIYERGLEVRRQAARYWRSVEQRKYYRTLKRGPRRDLAATTAGLIIQAVGRLVRGGVPFEAYFVDAAWGPEVANERGPDTPRTSLLAAMIDIVTEYCQPVPQYGEIGKALYEPLADALADTRTLMAAVNEKFNYNRDEQESDQEREE